MVDTYISPDSSGRGLPVFLAIALGVTYILGIAFCLQGHSQGMMWGFKLFPVAQFLYIAPLAFDAKTKGQRKAFQGWLIGAAIAALIYSPCWGLAWLAT